MELILFNKSNFDISEHYGEIEKLLDQHEDRLKQVRNTYSIANNDYFLGGLNWFFEDGMGGLNLNLTHTEKKLDSSSWSALMKATNLMEIMPAERKSKWYDMIRENSAPTFHRDLVYGTIDALAQAESKFMAERLDGVFRRLSKTHITNCPEGFNKRMIFTGIIDRWSSISSSASDLLTDLRLIISNAFGKEAAYADVKATNKTIINEAMYNYGSWTYLDGGSLRIKVFKNGNAHFEIHPEIAWQLNKMLASLHPTAIPSEFRIKPKKKLKDFSPIEIPLPFEVLSYIVGLEHGLKDNPSAPHNWRAPKYIKDDHTITLKNSTTTDKRVVQLAKEVLEAIGGTFERGYAYRFDYNPMDTLKQVVLTGKIPDSKSFQYYPTPTEISEYVATILNVRTGDLILEPSAGTGALLASLDIPDGCRTVAVELSELRCTALRNNHKIHEVYCNDFLKTNPDRKFDKILMNPPFSEGRAVAHVEKAYSLLAPGGVLVAVVPMGFKTDLDVIELKTFDNCFQNTGISVRVIKMVK